MRFLITGGAGFIGSAVVRHLINDLNIEVLNLDKLTYAGNLNNLQAVEDNKLYHFKQIDICDKASLIEVFNDFKPTKVMHLAAESHVDRSIFGPAEFINTNIIGTFNLLEVAKDYYQQLTAIQKNEFCFHHVSTDEVFGDLDGVNDLFTEQTPYAPSSPYSASKASSDHLVRAWHRTYKLPVVVTNCSNNYGSFHYPEKLIPLCIINAIYGRKIPIYGNGMQIRDWLFVDDHARALVTVALKGSIGETYNIGGHNEKTNLEVVHTICDILDSKLNLKDKTNSSHKDLITFVTDRLGHDKRYAIDANKIQQDLNWTPEESFESGLEKTVVWYLNNEWWWKPIYEKNLEGR